jgi:hypothetical protein
MRHARAVRVALGAFLLHFGCAAAILVGDQIGSGATLGPFDLVRVLRYADWPVLWAIDGLLQLDFFPVGWFAPNVERGYVAKAVVLYGTLGGAFYATLAGTVALLWPRRSPGPRA